MFLFKWFSGQTEVNSNAGKKVCQSAETVTIKKDDFDALLKRLNNLEAMIGALPQIRTPSLPISTTVSSANSSIISSPICERVCDKREVKLNPFQIELENRLSKLRERLGQSHGFGNFPLNDVGDLNTLERSVLEQSMIMNVPLIIRSKTPDISSSQQMYM